jgi:hypothetical protein
MTLRVTEDYFCTDCEASFACAPKPHWRPLCGMDFVVTEPNDERDEPEIASGAMADGFANGHVSAFVSGGQG